ncbi:ribonuclease H-like protein [Lichtheimia hyalospora FSU 10163]|nr:ribonuclease H-like protein [Lichtheimia hyalospora FSU 10163]
MSRLLSRPLRGKARFIRGIHTCDALSALDARLSILKAYELKDVAIRCGVATSGRKNELCDRIRHRFASAMKNITRHDQFEVEHLVPTSVVSLDLGYRNLAHVHLRHDNTIIAWDRIDLDIPEESSFHPSVSAPFVRRYIQSSLEPLLFSKNDNVGAVLVEQQRYREGGAAAVLETTIRVNCVEAMLWYALYDMVDRHDSLRTIPLMAIQRQAVDRVWAPDWEKFITPSLSKSKKSKTYQKKQACSRLVEQWLQEDQVVKCRNTQIKDAFIQQGKKDDLSDCLLQAMTWYQWRRFMVDYIQDALST